MTFRDFVVWLQGPGINVVVGLLWSVLSEHWAWFQDQPDKSKRFIYGGLCLIAPLVGAMVGCLWGFQPCGFEETFWPAIYQGALVAFAAGSGLHSLLFLGKKG